MSEESRYLVPGMHCGHCERAVIQGISTLTGVESVSVDLETKWVEVHGNELNDAAIRAAILEAGYAVA